MYALELFLEEIKYLSNVRHNGDPRHVYYQIPIEAND
jgi:hypothetical protein